MLSVSVYAAGTQTCNAQRISKDSSSFHQEALAAIAPVAGKGAWEAIEVTMDDDSLSYKTATAIVLITKSAWEALRIVWMKIAYRIQTVTAIVLIAKGAWEALRIL
eukprot:1148467-Pelagomonas_calceolata.AAC.3